MLWGFAYYCKKLLWDENGIYAMNLIWNLIQKCIVYRHQDIKYMPANNKFRVVLTSGIDSNDSFMFFIWS